MGTARKDVAQLRCSGDANESDTAHISAIRAVPQSDTKMTVSHKDIAKYIIVIVCIYNIRAHIRPYHGGY